MLSLSYTKFIMGSSYDEYIKKEHENNLRKKAFKRERKLEKLQEKAKKSKTLKIYASNKEDDGRYKTTFLNRSNEINIISPESLSKKEILLLKNFLSNNNYTSYLESYHIKNLKNYIIDFSINLSEIKHTLIYLKKVG